MALMPHAPATACMKGYKICLLDLDARLYVPGACLRPLLGSGRALAFQKDLLLPHWHQHPLSRRPKTGETRSERRKWAQ